MQVDSRNLEKKSVIADRRQSAKCKLKPIKNSRPIQFILITLIFVVPEIYYGWFGTII